MGGCVGVGVGACVCVGLGAVFLFDSLFYSFVEKFNTFKGSKYLKIKLPQTPSVFFSF